MAGRSIKENTMGMQRQMNIGFRNLVVWQEAKRLTLHIYKITQYFPKDEQFNLISQLRRAASSAMANLAEGSAMPTRAHRSSFYVRARGSIVEVDNFIDLSCELGLLSGKDAAAIIDQCARLCYLITNLIRST